MTDLKGLSHEEQKKRLSEALSQCSSVLDFSPEVVGKIFEIESSDSWKIPQIIQVANSLGPLQIEEIKEILDLARVARIMEEDKPTRGAMGMSGVTGPIGVRGPKGTVGATGPKGPGATGPKGPESGISSEVNDPALLAKFARIKKDLGLMNPIPGLPNIPKK